MSGSNFYYVEDTDTNRCWTVYLPKKTLDQVYEWYVKYYARKFVALDPDHREFEEFTMASGRYLRLRDGSGPEHNAEVGEVPDGESGQL